MFAIAIPDGRPEKKDSALSRQPLTMAVQINGANIQIHLLMIQSRENSGDIYFIPALARNTPNNPAEPRRK